VKNFTDKVIVITGAGSGIGRALAEEFSGLGAKLALNDINETGLTETVKLLPNSTAVFSKVVDVAKLEEVNAFATEVITHFGNTDVLINNAGVSAGKLSVEEIDIELFKWVVDINFWGVVYGTKAFLPNLITRPEAAVVNISSIFGLMGIGYQAPYCATKFAVRGFSESLAVEMHNTKVQVMSVHPAGIKTNIANNARGGEEAEKEEFNKMLNDDPNAIAKKIIKGIKRKNTRLRVGRGATLVDWMNRFKPYHIANFLQQLLQKQKLKEQQKNGR
ncbi:UNVERIFIED_CONTAM: hypothetical protein GTU68_032761, partial [Idotea baltica]|nr:hypothetical protein [Idotea baltica]